MQTKLQNQPLKLQNKATGTFGEDIAEDYLIEQGYTILFRNYQLHWGEIDIIATKEQTLYFVEVKTRIGFYRGKPYENITKAKMMHLMRSAQYFLQKNNYSHFQHSIDVISIVLSSSKKVIDFKHFSNILA